MPHVVAFVTLISDSCIPQLLTNEHTVRLNILSSILL